jgi:hypothetical protein
MVSRALVLILENPKTKMQDLTCTVIGSIELIELCFFSYLHLI